MEMMEQPESFGQFAWFGEAWTRFKESPYLAEIVAASGGLWAMMQMLVFAHHQESVLDEGAYLYKGWLFVTGQYIPYQPYGPWTNHMPLAFLIPGGIQVLFGPGLRTARYAAIACTMLMLLGMWLIAHRLGGKRWAAAVVWILAVNPFLLKTYSTAISQGLVACLLVWMLAFTLGEERPLWQIGSGSLLGGMIAMTRINLFPVALALPLYIWWQSGRKAALVSAVSAWGVIVGLHLIYWPGILQLWTRLPKTLTPFLNSFRLPAGYSSSWSGDVTPVSRLLSWFEGMRFNFIGLVGVLMAVLFWPKRGRWRSNRVFKPAVFLLFLFLGLLAAHTWASLRLNYCVFCLAGYEAFFIQVGLLLLILVLPRLRWDATNIFQVFGLMAVLLISTGIGYGTFEQSGEALSELEIPRALYDAFQPGTAPLGAVLINKFGFEAQELRRGLPAGFGFAAGLLLVGLTLITRQIAIPRRPDIHRLGPGALALVVFIALGALLTPTVLLSGGYQTYDCSGDVIEGHETAGAVLRQMLPPGAQVYWKGPLSVAPLLYVPDVKIYPPQINDGYSQLNDTPDPDLIQRLGRWSNNLGRQWARQADFILFEGRTYRGWLRDFVVKNNYDLVGTTPPTAPCREDSVIMVFRPPAEP